MPTSGPWRLRTSSWISARSRTSSASGRRPQPCRPCRCCCIRTTQRRCSGWEPPSESKRRPSAAGRRRSSTCAWRCTPRRQRNSCGWHYAATYIRPAWRTTSAGISSKSSAPVPRASMGKEEGDNRMGTNVGGRAVVLGGSLSALFAACALAEGYNEVVLVDRDDLIGVREARRGAPQGKHINGLLARGARAMEDLFPEITVEMVRAGCPLTDLAGTVRWYVNGVQLRQVRAGLTNVAARRPVMEAHVRERIQALS